MFMTERDHMAVEIRQLADRMGRDRSSLVPMLQEVKRKHHRIYSHAMQLIADELGIHPVEVHSVASFYAFLGDQPQGRFVIRLCRTISCDMQGKSRVQRQLENDLGVPFGKTTADGKFTLEFVECIGACDYAPAMLVNGALHKNMTAQEVDQLLGDLQA
jgi:NADH:ubiquinone oxidoreductase subunit E